MLFLGRVLVEAGLESPSRGWTSPARVARPRAVGTAACRHRGEGRISDTGHAPPRAECKSVRAKTVHSSWTAVDLAADRVAWARLLRRAHEVALSGRGTPPVLRSVIARSWERCVAAGVDVDRPAPRVFDEAETATRLAAHPLAAVVPLVSGSLGA